jgi:hypothetical protein
LLLSPRPYPGFLALQFESSPTALKLAEAEVLQVLVDAVGVPADGAPVHVDIESVSLQ